MILEDVLPKIKSGKRGLRESWNGLDTQVYYVPGGEYETQTELGKKHFGDTITYDPFFAIQSNDETIDMWYPSISDRLSDDWIVLD